MTMPEPDKQLDEWERLMLSFGDAVLRISTRHDEDGKPIHKIGWKLNDIEWNPHAEMPFLPLMEATRMAYQAYEDVRKAGMLG
jgi:hypothetical protein